MSVCVAHVNVWKDFMSVFVRGWMWAVDVSVCLTPGVFVRAE